MYFLGILLNQNYIYLYFENWKQYFYLSVNSSTPKRKHHNITPLQKKKTAEKQIQNDLFIRAFCYIPKIPNHFHLHRFPNHLYNTFSVNTIFSIKQPK